MPDLKLVRASISRNGGQWSDDDYDVFVDGLSRAEAACHWRIHMAEKIENPAERQNVTDPNHVRETFANGTINVLKHRDHVVLTFTTVRPEIGELITGGAKPKHTSVVVARIAMPTQTASELHAVLSQMFGTAAP